MFRNHFSSYTLKVNYCQKKLSETWNEAPKTGRVGGSSQGLCWGGLSSKVPDSETSPVIWILAQGRRSDLWPGRQIVRRLKAGRTLTSREPRGLVSAFLVRLPVSTSLVKCAGQPVTASAVTSPLICQWIKRNLRRVPVFPLLESHDFTPLKIIC